MLNRIRSKFVQKFKERGDLYDERDKQRVIFDDNYVLKFIEIYKHDFEKAFAAIEETIRWRKSFGVNAINADDFTEEFLGALETRAYVRRDKEEDVVCVCFKWIDDKAEWVPIYHKFIVYLMEIMENRSVEYSKRWCLLFDRTHADIEFSEKSWNKFCVDNFLKRFPQCIDYVEIYKIDWFWFFICKIIYFLAPSIFVSDFEILDESETKYFLGIEKGNNNAFTIEK
ncbi:Motile sperm domain-containing protein 2-like protein [Dinothrombium tinctorium]|uniref:Motile sperm domain-containing protein 2-like protein n=1 Tax=Dinothrombium tinctorium TaxID=1965070 RepID=A0A3S3PIE2_9ACAR|nr:Motile sperm domain-containing protein 2-like protein [Dinothrombium tinctorium]